MIDKKYLITGISGFVGFHILEYFNSLDNAGGIEILGIDIAAPSNFSLSDYGNLRCKFTAVDLMDYAYLEEVLVSFSPDYIIHLASFSSVSKSWEDPINSFINNTNIFLNILEIIRNNKIKCRILSVGSSEEYGNVSADSVPIKESLPLQPINPYAIARVSQEMLAKCYHSSFGIDIIFTRSFNHIGPMQREIFVVPSFVKQILQGIKDKKTEVVLSTGDISIIRDFVDVRDVVIAYNLLLEKGHSGEVYNVCTGKGWTLKQIIETISELLEIKVVCEVDASRIRPNDNRIIVGDNSKIAVDTGWRPQKQLSESLSDIIAYWKCKTG